MAQLKNILILFLFLCGGVVQGQGFLHTEGKNIVNGAGENVVLRGINTGNWMLQEGYMMKSSDVAGTHTAFRTKLEETIGEARTDSFYMAWLDNHMTRTDVDSMASWGFNSIRAALHYKWFTLPIEDEPVPGEQTWLDTGFKKIDSLLDWCTDNEIYLILDLHGAPGGQGKNAEICDYDSTKFSLWESDDNKDKTVALWHKLAERYADEPWIGGYDLINETNWTFPEGNNIQMRRLFTRITDSIRMVDTVHIIFIEGNSFANDYTNLTPPWDDNLVYSFHKYWNYNYSNSLDWVIRVRDAHNVPIWLGESGENSNHWYSTAIELCENNNVGWAWWPLKKGGMNNPLDVKVNEDYLQLIDNWRGKGVLLTEDEAFEAVMTWARNHHIDSCIYHSDVVDAMIRQPRSKEALPWRTHKLGEVISVCDYDQGRHNLAYFDRDTGNYSIESGVDYEAWNAGWSYRNDGVDMEACEDSFGIGFNVGWTHAGEWMAYTLESDSLAAYKLEIRSASGKDRVHLQVNGVDASGSIELPNTGQYQNWVSTEAQDVVVPAGKVQLKLYIEEGGSNLNYFRLFDPSDASLLPFRIISAFTDEFGEEITVSLNMPVSTADGVMTTDFYLTQDGEPVAIDEVLISDADSRLLTLGIPDQLFFDRELKLSYDGRNIKHGDKLLSVLDDLTVRNDMLPYHAVPGRIQAEDFVVNEGLVLEDCKDTGGGKNTGYADRGDYLEYHVNIEEAATYALDFRVATEYGNASLGIYLESGNEMEYQKTMSFNSTGGWQSWRTQGTTLDLPAGTQRLRLLVNGDAHNLNWFEFKSTTGNGPELTTESLSVYPLPASREVHIGLPEEPGPTTRIRVFDHLGRLMHSQAPGQKLFRISVEDWAPGLYLIQVEHEGSCLVKKLLVSR